MLDYKRVAVIDHDWSLYQIFGILDHIDFSSCYAIVHDEDVIDDAFWKDKGRVLECVINNNLGKRLEKYYD